jgi:16S rRNA (guanine966-N2)-methyltransferase
LTILSLFTKENWIVRITSGQARGRKVKAPKGIRPTQDRVREAYFSKMGDILFDARFLDLYAGSGAVGLEAWSRGASESLLVEQNRGVQKVLEANVRDIAKEGVKVVCAEVMRYLERPVAEPYDLIYADPPYVLADHRGFASELLSRIAAGQWLADQGVAAIERRTGGAPEDVDGWKVFDSRRYGESSVDYYILASETETP